VQLKKEATAVDKADPNAVAIAKAVEYLKKDVSTAKNADALRALFVASGKGYDLGTAVDGSLSALKQPAQWPQAERIAMANALAAAERNGKAASTDLEAAAKLLIADQQADGSFGTMLHTWQARTALIAAGIQPDNFTIVQIDKWVRGAMPETLDDAIATVLGLELASDVMAENLRRNSLSIIRQHQRDSGVFGTSDNPLPVLTTSLAILALSMLDTEPRLARSTYRPEELKTAIANAKRALVSAQRSDGSWPEATSWALLALVA
jgi:hypothetical protein